MDPSLRNDDENSFAIDLKSKGFSGTENSLN